jgi:hypothetical protein
MMRLCIKTPPRETNEQANQAKDFLKEPINMTQKKPNHACTRLLEWCLDAAMSQKEDSSNVEN